MLSVKWQEGRISLYQDRLFQTFFAKIPLSLLSPNCTFIDLLALLVHLKIRDRLTLRVNNTAKHDTWLSKVVVTSPDWK